MTDGISFPPLLDLPPDSLEAQKQHLLSEIKREPETRRRVPAQLRRPKLAGVALGCGAAVAAAVIGVFIVGTATTGAHSPQTSSGSPLNLPFPMPTVAKPLPAFADAKQTTLANAQTALGQTVVLPQTAVLTPSDAGPVWMDSLTDQQTGVTTTTVAVTFPAQGMIIGYTRPAPSDGSAAHFQAMAQSMPSPSGASEGQVISLNGGVPALAVQENSDDTGANFGGITFNFGGAEITVRGHNDESTLQSLAESILSRSSS